MPRNISAGLRRMYGGAAPPPPATIANLRDRAILGMLWHANASVDAVVAARVKDFYRLGGRRWLRLRDDGAERNLLVPAQLEILLDEYLTASGIAAQPQPETPLFRSTLSGTGTISTRKVLRRNVVKLGRKIANLQSVSLTAENAEALLRKMPPADPDNVRDRAIVGLMVYADASPREIAAIRAYDYLANNEWSCIKLGRSRIVQVPKQLHLLMRDYLRTNR